MFAKRSPARVALRGSALVVAVTIAGCAHEFDDIATAERVTLYSLDGREPGEIGYGKNPAPGGELHGYGVLGSTEIDPADQPLVADALNQGVQDSVAAACFLPRHAVRIESDGRQKDFVICFECYHYEVYLDGKQTDHGLIYDTPEPVLDAILKKAGIPLAPKAFSKEWHEAEEARTRTVGTEEPPPSRPLERENETSKQSR